MRQEAEWMVPSDDKILELIREYGNLTPTAIEDLWPRPKSMSCAC